MIKHLILSLFLIGTALSLANTDQIKGTLKVVQNTYQKDLSNQIYKIMQGVKAGVNSPQITNLGHENIRVITPSPQHGCSPYSIPDKFKSLENQQPIYFLVLGGDGQCSYARKAELAKKALGRGVIIVNSESKGINNLNLMVNQKDKFVILLIEQQAGSKLAATADFIARIDMNKNSKEHKTQSNFLQIWISSLNQESYRVLHDWRSVLKDIPAVKQKVAWAPRFALYSCASSQSCQAEYVSSCACGGEFCSPQQHSKSSDVLVREDIRQYFIYKQSPEKFLAYTKAFYKKCFDNYLSTKYAQDCSFSIIHDLQIDASISSQIDNFLSTCKQQDNEQNFKLYQNFALDRAKYTQIGHYPTIILNHQQIEFKSKQELHSQICRKLNLQQEQGCVHVSQSTIITTIISGIFYILMLGLLLGAGGFVVLFFRNRLRRDVNKQLKMQVSTAVQHYFTLSEAH